MKVKLLPSMILILALGSSLYGERLYSYVDDSGVRVLTNLGSDRGSPTAHLAPAIPAEEGNYAALIRQYGSQYGVDADLINAIIKVESAFNPLAVSPKNCKGLMQLHPDTARRFGVKDIFDPADNIEGGVKFLTFLMDTFERKLDLVLAAYNAGENAVRRFQGIPPYPETVEYVQKVKTLFGKDLEAPQPRKRAQRVVRMVDENGAIVLTNAPVERAAAVTPVLSSR